MKKVLLLFCITVIFCFTGCRKVVQKIPIDACTIPAHTEQQIEYFGTGNGKKPYIVTNSVPTTYMICYRLIYDDDSSGIRWEEVAKDEYDMFLEEEK